jgi:hypothetical protein
MFGSQTHSDAGHETEGNQARLLYYAAPASRIKVYKENDNYPNVSTAYGRWYWEGSAYFGSAYFCLVYSSGNTGVDVAYGVGGCAPAFCVK